MIIQNKLFALFQTQVGRKPRAFIAPGRINLIGEHTDYNEGFVMPAAIDKHFIFAMTPNGTDAFNINAIDLNEKISFSRSELKPGSGWQNYLMGVVDGFNKREKTPGGVDCFFSSTIPAGAGLSSSAALCSGFGFALNTLFQLGLDRLELAKIAQEAEHQFVGVKVGIMDMYASLFSKQNSAMLLDCRNYTHEYLPIRFEEHEILLIDSKVNHALASSAYNQRHEACEEGVKLIQQVNYSVKSLRDVNAAMIEVLRQLMDENIFKKCSYVVNEIERTKRAARLLEADDLIGFGKLMYETHAGLSQDYEVSCTESDWLVNFAKENHVTGARMMGGGFGGCTINLIKKEQRQAFEEKTHEKYFTTFKKEPDFYLVKLADGVHEVANG